MGVQVGDEGKVAYAVIGLNVGYVAHPHPVGFKYPQALDQVGVAAVVVVGVGGDVMAPYLYPHHQSVPAQHLDEGVTSRKAACLVELPLQHHPQFHATKSRVVPAVVPCPLHQYGFQCRMPELVITIPLVVRLSAVTKQPAQRPEREALFRRA